MAYKFHAETPVSKCIVFKFCTNVNATRIALLHKLFGESTIEDVIKNKNVLLPNFDHVLLPDTKIQSLGNKYSTIQAKWLWYYPNLDGTENEAVERDNEDPADALKKRDRNAKEIPAGKKPLGRPKKQKLADPSQMSLLSFFKQKQE